MAAKPKQVRLVCGLGNPGPEYERTRHNAGFLCVDALAERMGARYWKSEAGCQVARVTRRCPDGPRELVLAKPQDYMNTSGGPLSKLMRQLHVGSQEILVVHDEVDLEPGVVRAKFGGGLNAHNGLRSIANKLGTRDFARVRVGTGRPPGKMSVADYALREMRGHDWEDFLVTAQDAADVVEICLDVGMEEAIRRTGGV